MSHDLKPLVFALAGLMMGVSIWAANHMFRKSLWDSFLDEAFTVSHYFADQVSLALSSRDEVALGWAVRRAVMADVIYAQVVTDGEVKAQDAVADLQGLKLELEPPVQEVEVQRLRLSHWGTVLDVRRKLYGRGGEANLLLGYVRMGISARGIASRCNAFSWATSLGGAALLALFFFAVTVMTRSSEATESGGTPSPSGAIVIDDERKEVYMRGRLVNLSPKEYELLFLLASSPGRVFSVREILDALWPEGGASPEEVKRYIYLLRRKIEEDPKNPRHILTVKGFGYRFEP